MSNGSLTSDLRWNDQTRTCQPEFFFENASSMIIHHSVACLFAYPYTPIAMVTSRAVAKPIVQQTSRRGLSRSSKAVPNFSVWSDSCCVSVEPFIFLKICITALSHNTYRDVVQERMGGRTPVIPVMFSASSALPCHATDHCTIIVHLRETRGPCLNATLA